MAEGPAEVDLRRLDSLVRRAMAEWKVPGLAVAVVRGRQTVLAKGFGLRDVRRRRPVTPDTLFAVGSVTKAFTATAVGILVDEGKLAWDTPVREYLPTFRLHDPVATDRTTPRDLLCHRTGVPRHDFAWYGAGGTRRELLGRLRHLEPSQGFRASWQYQNLMYMAAGLVVEEVSGRTWERFVRERILEPLGMADTVLSVAQSQRADDVALPYNRKRGRAVRGELYAQGPIAPAGAVNSSVADMTRWLVLNLHGGRHGRRRIVSAKTLREIHTPQAVVPEPLKWPEVLHPMYALGWLVQAYRGRVMLSHGGCIDGFQARVGLLPREKIGIVVLTNLTAQPVPTLVSYYALDLLLGVRPAPWLKRMKDERDGQARDAAAQKRKDARARRKDTRPSQRLRRYVGEYRHDGYGPIRIERKGGQLRAVFAGQGHPLRHYHRDVFELVGPLWEPTRKVSFLADAEGRLDRLTVPLEPAVEPIVFRRVDDD